MENKNGVTGDYLGNMSSSVMNPWRDPATLWLKQFKYLRTHHINYKALYQKGTAKKRDFHDSLFLAYFYPNKLCQAAVVLLSLVKLVILVRGVMVVSVMCQLG